MDVTISLVAIALLLVLLLVARRAAKPKEGARPAVKRPSASAKSTAFHAVSIKIGSKACDAARDMDGRRFLSSAAPKIPLPECDAEKCVCRFVHHDDRRSGDERRDPWSSPVAAGETGNYRAEQRKGMDRRKTD